VTAIAAGTMYASIAQQPYQVVTVAFEAMLALIKGDTVELSVAVPMVALTRTPCSRESPVVPGG